MKVFTIAGLRRALFLSVAMVIASVGASGGQTRPQELVGRWLYASGSMEGPEENIELFKDGTGVSDGMSLKWKVENNRLVLLSDFFGVACDYKVSGYELVLTYDNRESATFVKKEHFEEYKKKQAGLKTESMKKDAEKRFVKNVGSFADSRDGQTYRTATIGGKTWMAQNLNYSIGKSWCYGDDNSNCGKYGRLYDWSTAKTACPSGWALPTMNDWRNLIKATGGGEVAFSPAGTVNSGDVSGWALKAANEHWRGGNGVDGYGFMALPGGARGQNGFVGAGEAGFWWMNDEFIKGNAFIMGMIDDEEGVNTSNMPVGMGLSVRCISNSAVKAPPASATAGAVAAPPPAAPPAAAPAGAVTAPPPAAQNPESPPVAAAYVTGDAPDYMKKLFATRLLSALASAGAGVSGDSSAAFLAAAEEERSKRGGALDDGMIRELAGRFGVMYVCVASINPVPGAYALSARVMSVKTGASRYGAEAAWQLPTMEDLANGADALTESMFGGKRVFGARTAPDAPAAAAVPDAPDAGAVPAAPAAGAVPDAPASMAAAATPPPASALPDPAAADYSDAAPAPAADNAPAYAADDAPDAPQKKLFKFSTGAVMAFAGAGASGAGAIAANYTSKKWIISASGVGGALLACLAADLARLAIIYIQGDWDLLPHSDARAFDWYFAPKYQAPVGTPVPWGGVNLEWGMIWGGGAFLGMDANFDADYFGDGRHLRQIGGGLSVGGVYDFGGQLQAAYGGAAGYWSVKNLFSGEYTETVRLPYDGVSVTRGRDYHQRTDVESRNFIAPFVKLRWSFVELSYRGLIGVKTETTESRYADGTLKARAEDSGFGWNNHQIMLGLYFATSKRDALRER